MKSFLYVATVEYSKDHPDGVCKKVLNQYRVFSRYTDVYLMAYEGSDVVIIHDGRTERISNAGKRHRKMFLYKTVLELSKSKKFDSVLFRYGYAEPWFNNLCRRVSKISKIIIEIPSYPYGKEAGRSIVKRLMYFVDVLFRRQLKHYVSRICCSYDGKNIFGIQNIQIQNGIIVSETKPAKHERQEAIHLICVSSMELWHGYERLIDGLGEYYRNGGAQNFVIDMVGEGKELNQYKSKAASDKLEDHVIFHGFLTGKNLDSVYNAATIAVTSLGLHRIGVFEENTIKTREYAAKGMLIVTGAKRDMFAKDYKYIMRVPPDESVVDFRVVEDFVNQFAGNQEKLLKASVEIRRYAETHFDMDVVMQPILQYITKGGK